MSEVGSVALKIGEVIARFAKTKLSKSEDVVGLLKALGCERLSDDFGVLYVHALVHRRHHGAAVPVLELLKDPVVVDALHKSWRDGNPDSFFERVTSLAHALRLGDQIRARSIDLTSELRAFYSVFRSLVAECRSPGDKELAVLLREVREAVVAEQRDRLQRIEAIQAQTLEVLRRAAPHGLPDSGEQLEPLWSALKALAEAQAQHFSQIRRPVFSGEDPLPIHRVVRLVTVPHPVAMAGGGSIAFEELSELSDPTVVLGEPGAGKSTCMQLLAFLKGQDVLEGNPTQVPLYLDLRWAHASLEAFAAEEIVRFAAVDLEIARALVASGPLLFLLDSFEEASEPRALMRDIRALAVTNPHCSILVSTRSLAGLERLTESIYELSRLDRGQVERLLQLYLSEVFTPNELEDLLLDLDRLGMFADLGNPMFLWFLSLWLRHVHRPGAIDRIAKGVVIKEVLEHYFLDQWEELSADRLGRSGSDSGLAELLSVLALNMIEDGDRIRIPLWAPANERSARGILLSWLRGRYSHPEEIFDRFVDICTRHGVLVERRGEISFWHKTIRNHFAARGLALTQSEVRARAGKPRWREPLVLACSTGSMSSAALVAMCELDPGLAVECCLDSRDVDPAALETVVASATDVLLGGGSLRERVVAARGLSDLFARDPRTLALMVISHLDPTGLELLTTRYEDHKVKPRGALVLQGMEEHLRSSIQAAGIAVATIRWRVKTAAAVLAKTSREGVGLSEIYDLLGLHIVVIGSPGTAYEALGIVHSSFRPIPGRFKDYSAMPKRDGYRALITVARARELLDVIIQTEEMHHDSRLQFVEVIIQTEEMHHHSRRQERTYHEVKYGPVLELLESVQAKRHVAILPLSRVPGVRRRRIGIFSQDEKGYWELPSGATAFDAAFRIHSQLGLRCKRVVVNGREVPRSYPVEDLARVQVIAADDVEPEMRWLQMVRCRRSIRAIRRALRAKERRQTQARGREILEASLRLDGLEYDELVAAGRVGRVATELSYADADAMLRAIAYDHLPTGTVTRKLRM